MPNEHPRPDRRKLPVRSLIYKNLLSIKFLNRFLSSKVKTYMLLKKDFKINVIDSSIIFLYSFSHKYLFGLQILYKDKAEYHLILLATM